MRSIPADLSTKLSNPIQTRANNSDPSASIWVGRPTTVLTNNTFLEKQTVVQAPITDSSIAVCHPRLNTENTKIYIGYVSNGIAKVGVALTKVKMSSHVWLDTNFSETADHISVAFDGTMPKNVNGKYEFLTESEPWVFWTNAGALYARKLGTDKTISLASENVTWISAVRATWSEVSGVDFGLCIFFIAGGSVYYRQLINGVWYDAEVISAAALPTIDSGITWTQVSASRTWDYRVALQLTASDGKMYELFTQFMGIGSKSAEHVELKHVEAEGKITKVNYHDYKEDEHIELSDVVVTTPYGGLYSLSTPNLISAHNISTTVTAEDGTESEDWGLRAIFVFDVHLKASEVAAQASAFTIVDERSITYSPSSAVLGDDGKSVTLIFTNFNNARGVCTAKYTPGTATTMADISMVATSRTFTPTGLVPSQIPVPKVSSIQNI